MNKISVYIEEQIQKSYLEYAVSTIISRALPDCRDGLKPVHRRILYVLSNNDNILRYRKSARIVGDVMGKYHPHGDAAIYLSMVRMSQNFLSREPLIDGQGNFGSIDGDKAAHMRYTEVKLSNIAALLLKDMDKSITPFQSNYDNSELEPIILPSMLPNILINGASGIAVGMSTIIPPHNMKETIHACSEFVDNYKISTKHIIKIVPSPDFPTGGIIVNASECKISMIKGYGRIVLRSKIHVESKKHYNSLVITQIPYSITKTDLIYSIYKLKRNKVVSILNVEDESNKLGIRVSINIKKSANSAFFANILYKKTKVQNNVNINMLLLKDSVPKILGIKDIILSFLEFRYEIVKKRVNFILKKSITKIQNSISLKIVIDNPINIIHIVKITQKHHDINNIMTKIGWNLSSNYFFNIKSILYGHNIYIFIEKQITFILNISLKCFSYQEKNDIYNNINEYSSKINLCISLLFSSSQLLTLIKRELENIKNKSYSFRITEVKEYRNTCLSKINISIKNTLIVLIKTGFIRRRSIIYLGLKGQKHIHDHEFNKDILRCALYENTKNVFILFSTGKMYRINNSIDKIYFDINQTKQAIKILLIHPIIFKSSSSYILFITSRGMCKKYRLSVFNIRINSSKNIANTMLNDYLINAFVCLKNDDIIAVSNEGRMLRVPISSIRIVKSRSLHGFKLSNIKKHSRFIFLSKTQPIKFFRFRRDVVVKLFTYNRTIINKLYVLCVSLVYFYIKNTFVLTFTNKGCIKRISVYSYRLSNRDSTGIINCSLKEGDQMFIFCIVKEYSRIMLINKSGYIIKLNVNSMSSNNKKSIGIKIIDKKYINGLLFMVRV